MGNTRNAMITVMATDVVRVAETPKTHVSNKNRNYILLAAVLVILILLAVFFATAKKTHMSSTSTTAMSYNQLANSVNSLVIAKKYQQAVAEIQSQKTYPNTQEEALLASVYISSGDNTKALVTYDKLLSTKSLTQNMAESAATAAQNANNIPKAVTYYKEAIDLAQNAKIKHTNPVADSDIEYYNSQIQYLQNKNGTTQ